MKSVAEGEAEIVAGPHLGPGLSPPTAVAQRSAEGIRQPDALGRDGSVGGDGWGSARSVGPLGP